MVRKFPTSYGNPRGGPQPNPRPNPRHVQSGGSENGQESNDPFSFEPPYASDEPFVRPQRSAGASGSGFQSTDPFRFDAPTGSHRPFGGSAGTSGSGFQSTDPFRFDPPTGSHRPFGGSAGETETLGQPFSRLSIEPSEQSSTSGRRRHTGGQQPDLFGVGSAQSHTTQDPWSRQTEPSVRPKVRPSVRPTAKPSSPPPADQPYPWSPQPIASSSGIQQTEPSVRPKIRSTGPLPPTPPSRRESLEFIPEENSPPVRRRHTGGQQSDLFGQGGPPQTPETQGAWGRQIQQPEPSVRPKVRPNVRPPSPPRAPRGDYIPDSILVRGFRDEKTGEPSLELMRAYVPPNFPEHPSPAILTYRSRRRTEELNKWNSQKKSRKKALLEEKGFRETNEKKESQRRYLRPDHQWTDRSQYRDRRRLLPTDGRDDNPIERPISEMDTKYLLEDEKGFLPVGRQSLGPRMRSYSMSDLRDLEEERRKTPNLRPSEQEFRFKMKRTLSSETLPIYNKFRDEGYVNNIGVLSRGKRLPPKNTRAGILGHDKHRVDKIRRNLFEVKGQGNELERKHFGNLRRKSNAELHLSPVPDDLKDLDPIPDEDEEEEEEEDEEEDTHL